MKLIAEKRSKTDKYDVLRFVRNNGSCTEALMPRQGILPHDLVHYVVESALPLRHGFLSLLARGADAQFVMESVHDKSNPNVETEAVQAEAIVEGLQAQLWSGAFDEAAFMEGAAAACTARNKLPFDFGILAVDLKTTLYDRALALNEQWNNAPFYSTLTLEFSPQPV
ncbi:MULTISPECIES: hypothetical protein [unclassified Duganella]|jgi:hypothetical protein|uniref:hypothetical protein n=1 Tax=unclassified Duganella TaxID=2636909 RepID=UPI00088A91A4|nr:MULTISPECIES: hypothetical protein [unclassified Duganella]SDG27422.1 hypothetical protein SAMN05216320_103463 [Duganella sp. OV458]SDJ20453.1 hypothetical protein SAMN05428973_10321 [Duganella sp. OV510]